MLKLFTENEAAKFMTRTERKTCKNTLKIFLDVIYFLRSICKKKALIEIVKAC